MRTVHYAAKGTLPLHSPIPDLQARLSSRVLDKAKRRAWTALRAFWLASECVSPHDQQRASARRNRATASGQQLRPLWFHHDQNQISPISRTITSPRFRKATIIRPPATSRPSAALR